VKNNSTRKLQLKINDLRKKCTQYSISTALYHHQVKNYANLIDKLLKEGVIKKEDVIPYTPKKSEILKLILERKSLKSSLVKRND